MNWPEHINWTRYFSPVGNRDALTDGIPVLNHHPSWLDKRDKYKLAELVTKPFLVLSGQPAMGKTTTFKKFFEKHPPYHNGERLVICVSWKDISNETVFLDLTFQSSTWEKWRIEKNQQLTLVVDGVDEGLIRAPTFLGLLLQKLKSEDLERLQVICICRSREWHEATGKSICDLWQKSGHHDPNPHVDSSDETSNSDFEQLYRFELCELSREDILYAAGACGINKADFWNQVVEKRVESFAANPYTLKMLFITYSHGGNALPQSQQKLYNYFSEKLSKDWDAERADRLINVSATFDEEGYERRQVVAERIAALLLRTKKTTIFLGDELDSKTNDLHWESICSVDEGDGVDTFKITRNILFATCSTGLFRQSGEFRFEFDHQTLAEFLAGKYFSKLPLPQIRQLLCSADDNGEYIQPQLSEVAAWCSVWNENFLNVILEIEPEILLRSDASSTKSDTKMKIAEAVLQRASREEHFDYWGYDYHYNSLVFPELHKVLEKYISQSTFNIVVRRMAVDIAEACKLTALLPAFLSVLQNVDESRFHKRIASNIGPLIESDTVFEIEKFIREPNDVLSTEVKVELLEALLEFNWTLKDAAPYLGELLDGDDYHSFNTSLAIEFDDLVPLLTVIPTWRLSLSGLGSLWAISCNTIIQCEAHFDDEHVFEALAPVVYHLAVNDELREPHHGRSYCEWLIKSVSKRRKIAKRIFESQLFQKDQEPWLITYALLDNESDFDWMLDQILEASEERKIYWIKGLIRPWHVPNLEQHWDKLKIVLEKCSDCKNEQRISDLYNFDTAKQYLQHLKNEREKHHAGFRATQKEKTDYESFIAECHGFYENGEYFRAWYDLSRLMMITPEGERDDSNHRDDITTTKRWLSYSGEEKAKVCKIAYDFVTNDESMREWKAQNINCEGHTAASKALVLFHREGMLDDKLLKAFAINWNIALFSSTQIEEGVHQDIAYNACITNGDFIRRKIRDCLRFSVKSDMAPYWLKLFERCIDDELINEMVRILKKRSLPGQFAVGLLDYLGEISPEACFKVFKFHVDRFNRGEIVDEVLFTSVCCSSLPYVLSAHWDYVWSFLSDNLPYTEKLFLRIAYHERLTTAPGLPKLKPKQLADLYLMLAGLFPHAKDPETPRGAHSPTYRMVVSRYRDNILSELESYGDEEACKELLRISTVVPSSMRIWIRRIYTKALIAKRQKNFDGLSLSKLNSLFAYKHQRLVRNQRDLQLAILESLERLQSWLKNNRNVIPANFWDYYIEGKHVKQTRHRQEDDIRDEIIRWFERDFESSKNMLFHREVLIRKRDRNDILVQAASLANPSQQISLIIEVKGCWHSHVKSSIKTQLVKYLEDSGDKHGIYLVLFFDCKRWRNAPNAQKSYLKSKSIKGARNELSKLAMVYDGLEESPLVETYVLDLTF